MPGRADLIVGASTMSNQKQMNYGRCNQNVTRENREEECKVQ